MKFRWICRSSVPQVFYKVDVPKDLAKFTGEHQRRSLFFNKVVGWRLKVWYFIKKLIPAQWFFVKFANFEEHIFYREAAENCFWIYQNINCCKVTVSQLVISKSYTGLVRTGRSKLFFPAHINYCLRPATWLKKRLWRRCFPVDFAKFLRTPFLQITSRRLLLNSVCKRSYDRFLKSTGPLEFLILKSNSFNSIIVEGKKEFLKCLTLIRLGFLRVFYFGGGAISPPVHISRKT